MFLYFRIVKKFYIDITGHALGREEGGRGQGAQSRGGGGDVGLLDEHKELSVPFSGVYGVTDRKRREQGRGRRRREKAGEKGVGERKSM